MVVGNYSANFINDTTTSAIMSGLFNNVGGSWFMTIMLIVIFLIVIALILRIPMELTAIVVFPFLLVCGAYLPDLYAVVGVFLIYLGVLMANNWFIKN
jgi:hypothetical protein